MNELGEQPGVNTLISAAIGYGNDMLSNSDWTSEELDGGDAA